MCFALVAIGDFASFSFQFNKECIVLLFIKKNRCLEVRIRPDPVYLHYNPQIKKLPSESSTDDEESLTEESSTSWNEESCGSDTDWDSEEEYSTEPGTISACGVSSISSVFSVIGRKFPQCLW
jgi:hypothetical protein